MKKKNHPGCPCCTGPCTWIINVNDCLARRSGVTVTVTQGASTYTGTTNGSGTVTFTGLFTGSATATATAPTARFANTSATRTLVSGSQTDTINLGSASGYVCAGTFGCTDPIPDTLYGTFWHPPAGGSTLIPDPITLTYSGGFWFSAWLSHEYPLGSPAGLIRVRLGVYSTWNVSLDEDEDGDGSYIIQGLGINTAVTCNPFVLDRRLYHPTTGVIITLSMYITE